MYVSGHNGHQSSGHIRPGIASPRTPRPKDRVSAAIPSGTTVNFPDCNKQNEPWPRRRFGRLYETMRPCFFYSRLTSHRALDVSRPDRLSSAEISSVVQAAGLQGTPWKFFAIHIYLLKFTAVRKNRYVILPIDFEEAWKVSCFLFFFWFKVTTVTLFTSKLSRETTRHTNFVRMNLSQRYPYSRFPVSSDRSVVTPLAW